MGHVIFIIGLMIALLGVFAGAAAAITYIFFDKNDGIMLIYLAIGLIGCGGIIGFIGFAIIYISTIFM